VEEEAVDVAATTGRMPEQLQRHDKTRFYTASLPRVCHDQATARQRPLLRRPTRPFRIERANEFLTNVRRIVPRIHRSSPYSDQDAQRPVNDISDEAAKRIWKPSRRIWPSSSAIPRRSTINRRQSVRYYEFQSTGTPRLQVSARQLSVNQMVAPTRRSRHS